mmetsp:Transcript_55882/g.145334  ORF Transcript_55882/g.145334 Transcript_55882/m.145334 type:complete len:268 (+) Transcript_55882:340-1143(+)
MTHGGHAVEDGGDIIELADGDSAAGPLGPQKPRARAVVQELQNARLLLFGLEADLLHVDLFVHDLGHVLGDIVVLLHLRPAAFPPPLVQLAPRAQRLLVLEALLHGVIVLPSEVQAVLLQALVAGSPLVGAHPGEVRRLQHVLQVPLASAEAVLQPWPPVSAVKLPLQLLHEASEVHGLHDHLLRQLLHHHLALREDLASFPRVSYQPLRTARRQPALRLLQAHSVLHELELLLALIGPQIVYLGRVCRQLLAQVPRLLLLLGLEHL